MIKDTTFTYEQIMEMLDRLVRASGPQSQDFTFALQLVRNNIMSMAIGAHDQHESMKDAVGAAQNTGLRGVEAELMNDTVDSSI